MKNPMYNIDDLFYKGVEEHSEHPDDNVWNNIEAELDKDVAAAYKRKYRTVRRNALILLVMLCGFVVYEAINLYQKKESSQSKLQAETNTHRPAVGYDFSGTSSGQHKNSLPPIIHESYDIPANKLITGGIETKLADDVISKTGRSRSAGIVEANEIFDRVPEDRYEQTNKTDIKPRLLLTAAISNESLNNNVKAKQTQSIFPYTLPALTLVNANEINSKSVPKSRFFISAYLAGAASMSSVTTDYRRHGRGNGNNNANNGGNSGGNTSGNNGGNNGNSNNNNNNGLTSGNVNGGGGRGNRGDRHDMKQSESGNMAWSAGIKLGYNLNRKVSLETGLNYLETSTSVKPKKIFAEKDGHGGVGYRLNCSSGYAYLVPEGMSGPSAGDSVIISDTRNAVSYLGVPVSVKYKILSGGRFSLNGSAGGQLNVLLNASTKTVLGKGTASENTASNTTEGLRPTYLSALASLEGEMRLNKNLSLTVSPAAQVGLSNVNKKSSVKTRPHYFGVAAGLKVRL